MFEKSFPQSARPTLWEILKSFSNTLWFVTGKQDLVKMWFDISGADIIQSYLIEKFMKGVCGSQKELRG